MKYIRAAAVAGIFSLPSVAATGSSVNLKANPIRKVVNMLDSMLKKVEAEGKAEEELFNKFMCYCKNGRGALEKSVADAEAKAPQIDSSIKSTAAEIDQLAADLKAAQSDRADAKKAVEQATALRTKEEAEYSKVSGDFKANIAAMSKAVAAIEQGAGGFLQTSAANLLKKISITMDLNPGDRDTISAFLATSNGQSSEYAPASGEITGILKQMKDTMEADLADASAKEKDAIQTFDAMAAAKAKEIQSLTDAIESKTVRLGEAKVELVNLKNDLDDTQAALLEDKKFLKEMDKSCGTKEAEWAERQKMRAEEMLALHDTIKILNDDDALELFKKTLPSASLLEMKESGKMLRQAALKALKLPRGDVRVDLLALALKGKKVNFDKVIKMVDEMVALLAEEQTHDDGKKEYCETSIDAQEDKIKELERKTSDLEKSIEEGKNGVETLTKEIKALEDGIEELDKSVAEATEQRKDENSEFVATLAANKAAVDLLGFAKNRLNKFYNPSQYKAPPKRELSREDRIAVNMGGTAPPTPAPGGIAGTGITAFVQVHSQVQSQKAQQESAGVIAMMDLLLKDLAGQMTVAETEEKNAQEDYEKAMADAKEKRLADAKLLGEKITAKAETDAALEKHTDEKASSTQELMGNGEYIASLHADCDWLLENFEQRETARTDEVDAMLKAKDVLKGADYSLLEVKRSRARMN